MRKFLPSPIRKSKSLSSIRNQRGQGLIEYLILVALMGVATISIVRVMGNVVSGKFASVTSALQGRSQNYGQRDIPEGAVKKRDLGDFFKGVGGSGEGQGQNNGQSSGQDQ